MPGSGASIVNDRKMPNINLQHLLAVALVDGEVTFESSHSYERMNDPVVLDMKKRINLIESPESIVAERPPQAIIEVTTMDDTQLREEVIYAPGTAENPLTTEDVEQKCKNLISPVLGEVRSKELIDTIASYFARRRHNEMKPVIRAFILPPARKPEIALPSLLDQPVRVLDDGADTMHAKTVDAHRTPPFC